MRVLVAVAVVGCNYAPKVGEPPPDVPPGPCQALGDTCGNALTMFSCTAIDVPPMQLECPWGCLDAPARCGTLRPAGGGATTSDLAGLDGLGDITLADGATIDGDGTITMASSPNFDHELRGPGSSIAVFRFKRLTIAGDLRLLGNRGIVLISDAPITIGGVILATGPCGSDNNASLAGPGGFSGSIVSRGAGLGPGGLGGTAANAGGGGGANGGKGGRGGNTLSDNGGTAFGTPEIALLFGGQGGGAGGGGGGFGRGGGGGGAVQLISNTAIVFALDSGINAGGCGGDGDSGGGADGGGGGGAGGTILLEAPLITGPGVLAVNGGGGGSGGEGPGDTGEAGTLSSLPAHGQPGGQGAGGDGGAGASLAGSPGVADANDGAGGGGGVGRIRINTQSGDVGITGDISPALTANPTTSTSSAAPVE